MGTAWMVSVWKAIWRDEGAALVEATLIGAILFPVMLLGTVEVGSLVYASIESTDAAHAGAAYVEQYYMISNPNLPLLANVVAATQKNEPDLTSGLLTSAGTTPTVYMSCGCPAAGGAIPAAPPQPMVNGSANCTVIPSCTAPYIPVVQVTTSSTVVPLIHFSGLGGSLVMSNTASIPLVAN